MVNFPLLSKHPVHDFMTTTLRDNQTYDQIGVFSFDKRLPRPDDNDTAGQGAPDDYDYGVFRLSDILAKALYGKLYPALDDKERKALHEKAEHDISDHMPAWIRVRIPGA